MTPAPNEDKTSPSPLTPSSSPPSYDPDISRADIPQAVMEEIIQTRAWGAQRLVPRQHPVPQSTPPASFVIRAAPVGGCGLSRTQNHRRYLRRHGLRPTAGGAFSGKDPSQSRSLRRLRRSLRRQKTIVAAGLAQRCEIQVSYDHSASPNPTSIAVKHLRHRPTPRRPHRHPSFASTSTQQHPKPHLNQKKNPSQNPHHLPIKTSPPTPPKYKKNN